MFKHFVILAVSLFFVHLAHGSGEFIVIHSPDSVMFQGSDRLKESNLHEVLAAALGYTTKHYINWQGMYIDDPFSLPSGIVTVAVDGLSKINLQEGRHFPLKTDATEDEVFEALERKILAPRLDIEPVIIREDLSNDLNDIKESAYNSAPTEISHKFLKLDIEEDREFLREINMLYGLANKLKDVRKQNAQHVYWFVLKSLHPFSDLHGENSTETLEAKQILNDAILYLRDEFTAAFDGSILVNVITSDSSHTRRARNILETEVKAEEISSDKKKYNLASYYNKDYPVIFNIVLWFGVIMLFSLIAICLAIGNMDPGRDSIIYRMTSTRMKKDN